MANTVSASVRMYKLKELGDCFLLTFKSESGTSRMLIDCGSFRNGKASIQRLERITRDIGKHINPPAAGKKTKASGKKLTARGRKNIPIDVVVGTHQHNDHVSGFYHCKNVFRSIGVNQVWLSWLDDPQDGTARNLGKTYKKLKGSLFKVVQQLARSSASTGIGLRKPPLTVLHDVLGFYGAKAKKSPPLLPAEAVDCLKKLGNKPARYLHPGQVLDMPGLPKESVRIYVLGPPRESDWLYRKDPRTGESYDHALAAKTVSAEKFFAAIADHGRSASRYEKDYPFTSEYKHREKKPRSEALRAVRSSYNSSKQRWRNIDDDWLNQAESLALYLDTFTNNSSLALAIELVDSKKVLLFAADAQTGNWLSWADVKWERKGVTTDDLLARTVFYKVGHHASHNATLKPVLEKKITHPDLCALIPVHKDDPNIKKDNGWKMPARNLFKHLQMKTSNRVLRMDGLNLPPCDPGAKPAADAWKAIGIRPKETELFIELDFAGKK